MKAPLSLFMILGFLVSGCGLIGALKPIKIDFDVGALEMLIPKRYAVDSQRVVYQDSFGEFMDLMDVSRDFGGGFSLVDADAKFSVGIWTVAPVGKTSSPREQIDAELARGSTPFRGTRIINGREWLEYYGRRVTHADAAGYYDLHYLYLPLDEKRFLVVATRFHLYRASKAEKYLPDFTDMRKAINASLNVMLHKEAPTPRRTAPAKP